jgi:hypothetical protein
MLLHYYFFFISYYLLLILFIKKEIKIKFKYYEFITVKVKHLQRSRDGVVYCDY